MSNANLNSNFKEKKSLTKCYRCDCEIFDFSQKYCQNCNAILKPNELKWRNSFILCICLLCLIPFLIALISILTFS